MTWPSINMLYTKCNPLWNALRLIFPVQYRSSHNSSIRIRTIPFMNELFNIINILFYWYDMLHRTNITLRNRTLIWDFSFKGCHFISQCHHHGCNNLKPSKWHTPEFFCSKGREQRGIVILLREEVKNVFNVFYIDIWITRTWFPDYVLLFT